LFLRKLKQATLKESLSPAECVDVKYQGIRPAPGYPTQPDHSEKETMWKLMQIKEVRFFFFCREKKEGILSFVLENGNRTDRESCNESCRFRVWSLLCLSSGVVLLAGQSE
jgi:hypothetical protein